MRYLASEYGTTVFLVCLTLAFLLKVANRNWTINLALVGIYCAIVGVYLTVKTWEGAKCLRKFAFAMRAYLF